MERDNSKDKARHERLSVKQVKYVSKNFENFRNKEGSQHIATFSSQLNFLEKFCHFEFRHVLDYGSGIGTFVPLILEFSKAKITSVERNEWCQNEFRTNIYRSFEAAESRVFLRDSIPFEDFDVIIIDDEISRAELRLLLSSSHLGMIFVEGWRNKTVGQISRRLMLYGYEANFSRGDSRLEEFSRRGKALRTHEKGGSTFILRKGSRFSNLKSWLLRVRETKEFMELFKALYFFSRRKISVRSRLKKKST
jgi:SAM-dependent methyltransferase